MPFCPKCGREVSGQYSICPYCGQNLRVSPVPLTKAKKGFPHKKLVALVLILVVTIPSAFLGLLYYQMNSIQIRVEFPEAQVINWLLAILFGNVPDISVRLVFTNPTFLAVDVTNIYAQLFVEDKYAFDATISSLYIPAGKTVHEDLTFSITEAAKIASLVSQASSSYGGEIKVSLSGHGTAHLLFLSMRLPFSMEQYYMTREGSLRFESARWVDSNGNTISTASKNAKIYVEVKVVNPTRKHTITGEIGVRVMRDIPLWFDEQVGWVSQSVTVSPSSSKTITFPFSLRRSSTYHFDIFADDRKVYTQPNTVPPRLRVRD